MTEVYAFIWEYEAFRNAEPAMVCMADCDDVFYCVVDTRAWLRDPAPLFRTNVEGLRHVLDAAVDADPRRFVFTSTIGTIGVPAVRRPATEADQFNLADKGGAYIRSRVDAEDLVMRYAQDRGLPATCTVDVIMTAFCQIDSRLSIRYGPGWDLAAGPGRD